MEKADCIIYTRVSSDEQRVSGVSLQEQEIRLRSFCKIHNLNVLGHYQDDCSAKTFHRPSFIRFLDDFKKKKIKPSIFLCVRLDRFSRNLMESLEMLKKFRVMGIEFRTVEKDYSIKTPEDFFYYVLDSTLAQVENDRRGLNTIVAMRHCMRQGRWVWRAPIGYRNITTNKTLEIDELSAPHVRKGFELMSSGLYTAEQVRRMLSAEGFRCSKQQFLNIIKNPFYAGKVVVHAWKEEPMEIVSGKHPALISEELFQQVQLVLSGRKKPQLSILRASEFPLRGILHCRKCGAKLTASASRSRNKVLFRYYHCQTKYNCNERFRADLAHEQFLELLNSLSSPAKILKSNMKRFDALFHKNALQKKNEIGNQQAELEKIHKLIEIADEKYLLTEIDSETYTDIKQKLLDRQSKIESQFNNRTKADSQLRLLLNFAIKLMINLKDFYQWARTDIRHVLIGSILPVGVIFEIEKYRTAKWGPSFEVILQIFNQLQDGQKRKVANFDDLSALAPPPGLEPGTP